MKKVFNTSEVPHIWARQSQEEGRNSQGNIYFNGKDIFSYGRHFCMGHIIDSNTVLLTNRSYSNTTAKHLSETRYAVRHMNSIYCSHPNESLEYNLEDVNSRLKNEFATLTNSRKRPQTKENAKGEIAYILENTRKLFDAFGQSEDKVLKTVKKIGKDWSFEFLAHWESAQNLDLQGLELAKQKIDAKVERARKAKEKRIAKELQEDVERWLQGERAYIQNYPKVLLRVNEEIVETSKGAKVSLQSAKVLFELIKAGKDVKGFDIDGYTVISLNGMLKIGCHEIERDEINRFATLQNWV